MGIDIEVECPRLFFLLFETSLVSFAHCKELSYENAFIGFKIEQWPIREKLIPRINIFVYNKIFNVFIALENDLLCGIFLGEYHLLSPNFYFLTVIIQCHYYCLSCTSLLLQNFDSIKECFLMQWSIKITQNFIKKITI